MIDPQKEPNEERENKSSWGIWPPLLVGAFIVYMVFFRDVNFFGDDLNRVVLFNAIASNEITLKANGTDQVNGPAVKGWLVNNTEEAKRVSVNLAELLYLKNSDGGAQNMIATRVYRRGATGEFYREKDGWKHLFLRAGEHVPVLFIAYCADQDKATPDTSDSFTLARMPNKFTRIGESLKRYRDNNQGDNIYDGAQEAIWRAQGVPVRDMIRLDVDEDDRRIANEILDGI